MQLLEEVRALGRQKIRVGTTEIEARIDHALKEANLSSAERLELGSYQHLFSGALGECILQFLRLAQTEPEASELALERALATLNRLSDQEGTGEDGYFEHVELARIRDSAASVLNSMFPEHSESPTYLLLVERVNGSAHLDLLLADPRCTIVARKAIQSTIINRLVGRLRYTGSFRDTVEAWKTLLRYSRQKQGLDPIDKLHGSIAIEQKALGLCADPAPAVKAMGERLVGIMSREPQLHPGAILLEQLANRTSPKTIMAASRFARDSMLYTTVFKGCENVKLDALSAIMRAIETAPSARTEALASELLNASSRLKAFWTDDAFRDQQIALVHGFVTSKPTTMIGNLVHARSAFARGDIEEFERIMSRMKKLPVEPGKSVGYTTYRPLGVGSDIPMGPAPQPITLLRKPPQIPKGVTLVACADMGFFRTYAVTVVRSLRQLSPDAPIHFHIVASGPETSEALALIAGDDHTSLSCEASTIAEPYYYAMCRFVQAAALLRLLKREIAIVDIDIGVTSDPVLAITQADRPYDVMMRVLDRVRLYDHNRSSSIYYDYPRLDPWSSIPAGYLFLRNSPGGLDGAGLIARTASSFIAEHQASPAGKWWIDQNLLFHCYAALQRDLPHVSVGNIADIGMPYDYARPKAPALQSGIGRHPMMQLVSRSQT